MASEMERPASSFIQRILKVAMVESLLIGLLVALWFADVLTSSAMLFGVLSASAIGGIVIVSILFSGAKDANTEQR